MCAITSCLQSTWRTLLFSESVPEPQSCGFNVSGPSLGSVPGVNVCGSGPCRALERPAQEAEAPVGFDFPSVKQRSENRAPCEVQGSRVPVSLLGL